MKIAVCGIVVLACLILEGNQGSAAFLEEDCGDRWGVPIDQIVGGTVANIKANPWMAYLHVQNEFLGGGTIIHSRFILTAAHCIVEGETVTARLGEYDTQNTRDCRGSDCIPPYEDYEVDRAYRHRSYTKALRQNDIGMLRLARRVQFGEYIHPICLLVGGDQSKVEAIQSFLATGWGMTNDKTYSRYLRTILLNRLDRTRCSSAYNVGVGDHQICAGSPEGSTCLGDSGGPLGKWVRHKGKVRYVQFGIVSYGNAQCVSPSVYTDVMSYIPWIEKVVQTLDN